MPNWSVFTVTEAQYLWILDLYYLMYIVWKVSCPWEGPSLCAASVLEGSWKEEMRAEMASIEKHASFLPWAFRCWLWLCKYLELFQSHNWHFYTYLFFYPSYIQKHIFFKFQILCCFQLNFLFSLLKIPELGISIHIFYTLHIL